MVYTEETANSIVSGKRSSAIDKGEPYTFTFSQDDVEYIAFVGAADDSRHALILVGSGTDNRGVRKILDSLTGK